MDVLQKKLDELRALLSEDDINIIKEKMTSIVPTYHREDTSEEVAVE